jgi:hypothetical protein
MKWLDYLNRTSNGLWKYIKDLLSRMNTRECYTPLKNYTTDEMNALPDPQVGWLIFNTTENEPYVYVATTGWVAVNN